MVRLGLPRGVAPSLVRLTLSLLTTGLLLSSISVRAEEKGGEDPRTAARFLQGLRDRGYYDLAAEYLEQVRTQPDAPMDLVSAADYELGRLLLDEATKTGDLVRRKDLLDQARVKLDSWTKAHPDHPRAPEALVELARLLVERGHLGVLQADEIEAKAEKDAKLASARASFDQARVAYEAAEKRLQASFDTFPAFIPENEQARKDEKERTHNALMQAQLQKAIADYEKGETYPPGAPERTEILNKALAQFDILYKKYRKQMAGLSAQMWMGKCYEERGDLGAAMGVYNQLMEHSDPRLRALQRHVGYFRIIVLGKRKEYALAADEAVRWLQEFKGSESLRSIQGLGVQMELAKDILAQLPQVQSTSERNAAIKKVVDTLSFVVRYTSPFKAEAIALLKQYKPSAALNATDVAKLNYEDAVSQGEQAIAAHEWVRAVALWKQAIRRAEAARDIDKTNYARHHLALSYYMNQQFYEADVLCEHLARRYPRAGLSPKAAEIGMAALIDAYNTYTQIDRETDLNNLIDLAQYTASTFPDVEAGDSARTNLGMVYGGLGKYPEAIEAFASVRAKSEKFLEARTRLGGAHWDLSQSLRRAGKTAEADAEVGKAIETLKAALKSRQEAGEANNDPDLVRNACDLADVYLETGKSADALALLEPLARPPDQGQPALSGPVFTRLISDLLRAHIGVNQVDQAVADMGRLEQAGGTGPGQTQLYYRLGKLLETEIDALKTRGDRAGLNRTQQAYQKFLSALVKSKSGQTYESLRWAGDSMLAIGHPKEAEAVYRQVLETYEKDPKFMATTNASDRMLVTRVKLASALRVHGDFAESSTLINSIIKDHPKSLEALFEKGLLLEDEAKAGKATWPTAFNYWQALAKRLGTARTKTPNYFEAWYHAALALKNDNKPREAKQTLALVMRLSSSVGGPEMKKKYKSLLDEIQ